MKYVVFFTLLPAFSMLFSGAVYAKTSLKSSAGPTGLQEADSRLSKREVSAGKPGMAQNRRNSKALSGQKQKARRLAKGQKSKARRLTSRGGSNKAKKPKSAKRGLLPGAKGKKQIIISDKTGLPVRTINAESLRIQVSEQLQPLFQICELRGKTTRQKTTLFIEQLHKVREYAINNEDDFIGEDRRLLLAIQAHLDHFLEYMGDWTKKAGPMNTSEMRDQFEHTYRYRYKIPENVPTEAVAPWWIRQILAVMSCLNRNQSAVKKET